MFLTYNTTLLTPFEEIPTDFILKNFNEYQKRSVEIKYHIKVSIEEWDGKRSQIYEQLSEELCLSFERVRKIALKLWKQKILEKRT